MQRADVAIATVADSQPTSEAGDLGDFADLLDSYSCDLSKAAEADDVVSIFQKHVAQMAEATRALQHMTALQFKGGKNARDVNAVGF